MISIEEDNYHDDHHGSGDHSGGLQPNQILSYIHPAAIEDGPALGPLDLNVSSKKRKADSLTNVSMKTVMRWKGKEGIEICCLLGASENSTAEERTKAEEVLIATGQLLCILCGQSVSGNKKSVRRHQFKNARHIIRLNEIAAGQPFPSTEAAMNICVPMPYIALDNATTASKGCLEAWDIVRNCEKANDYGGLTSSLESLGVFASRDLGFCSQEELSNVGAFLKAIPRRNFFKALGIERK